MLLYPPNEYLQIFCISCSQCTTAQILPSQPRRFDRMTRGVMRGASMTRPDEFVSWTTDIVSPASFCFFPQITRTNAAARSRWREHEFRGRRPVPFRGSNYPDNFAKIAHRWNLMIARTRLAAVALKMQERRPRRVLGWRCLTARRNRCAHRPMQLDISGEMEARARSGAFARVDRASSYLQRIT